MSSTHGGSAPKLSYFAADATGRVLASSSPDTVFYAASTIKLAVLIAAMRQVDAGRLELSQPVLVKDRFPSRLPGAGDFTFDAEETDAGMPPAGSTVTLAEALGRMVYASSNSGTNMVLELTGMEAAAEALSLCGAESSRLERLISDHAARDAGYTHETTAADLVRIMHAVISGAVAGPDSTGFMLEQLRRQEHPVIGAVLPATADWGSKSGWVDGIHHDVAFIGSPGEPGSYVLAVCTQGYGPEQAVAAIKSVAAAVHQDSGLPNLV
ncbi:serine hydrolase [Arthrobacter sp.]|uniref:serine hydrolase n=1 Tax=Arthrobacter sp. TaxID=1667 RepID=UPI0028A180D5|nr:serine hydrolase [Arthrobacter sp.]